MTSRRHVLAALAVATLGGCAGPPDPAVVELTLSASPDVNGGRSVAVRVYGLGATGRFTSATAYTLIDRDTVLGDEGTRVEETVVRPGETRKITLMPKPNVRYIGVVVLFQDIDRAQWRGMAPIAASGLTRLRLALGSNAAQLVAA
ncbi:MAG: type VI secretion system lipoprotein TssJ [Alphaproteobacteria bacterium]|nr:type VI secretion system lipoprotein TssJ [Alphaproteobacteria bacterium]MBV8410740.1 type VI secretion system lipoprotein TssJ [Alphaproteobacteria bacterium]